MRAEVQIKSNVAAGPGASRLRTAPGAGRGGQDPPLAPSGGAGPCPHLGFRLLASEL